MNNKGFTLIELIIVIVLLGILAATALPRFVDFSTDARDAKYKATAGAFNSAFKTFHLKWQANGKKTTPIDGIYVNVDGYPTGIDGGNTQSSGINGSNDCLAIWNAFLPNGPTAAAYTPGVYSELQTIINNQTAAFAVRTSTNASYEYCKYIYIEGKSVGDTAKYFHVWMSADYGFAAGFFGEESAVINNVL